MKKIILPALFVLALLVFSTCDKVEPPYIDGNQNITDTTECPVPTFPVKTSHVKTILIEEYTGHTCPNCPNGATVIHNIKTANPDKAISVAIHAGFLAEPETGNYSLDLRTAVGNELNTTLGIAVNPSATFNRKTIGGTKIFESPSNWASTFIQADMAPVIDMQMINDYDHTLSRCCIHIQTEFLDDVTGDLKLAVYITEDSIVGYQKTLPIGTEIPDYVFMDVLRGAVNSTWGDVFSTGTVTAGT
jgi:hypothetical protein